MWNAFRSDLKEFMSTVTEDTSNVLSQLDAGMGEAAGENADNDATAGEDVQVQEKAEEEEIEINPRELKEIMTLLRDHPGTYTEDLADEDDKEAVEEFLKDFSIDAHTDEIAKILEEHAETVKKHFEELCPTQVSYEEFWKRYFYRCNEQRIARQLREETERDRKARAEAIEAGLTSVTNFFGGAVAAVTNTIAPEASTNNDGTAAAEQQGINFFGAKGRPPFVMNTAMDESGEDDEFQEDEEELGWDDDDDDDDFQDEQGGVATGQIEFTDKVAEELREKLKQANEERDQIQQTVQMQAEEMKSLRIKLQGGDEADAQNDSEVDELKLKLFEKDAELAALKASASDDNMEGGKDSLEEKLRALPPEQLAKLKADLFGMEEQQGNKDDGTHQIAALQQQVQELTAKLESKEATVQQGNDKVAALSQELESSQAQLSASQSNKQEAESQLSSVKQELLTLQQKEASLAAQLKAAGDKLQQTEETLKRKEAELALAKQAGPSPPSPDSSSTGVKVETSPTATKLELDEDIADDGWGDDWD